MYTEGFDQFLKMNRKLTSPITELNKTSTELCRCMAEENLDTINENFSRFSSQLKRLSDIKTPEDFINLQQDCINENMTASIDAMQKTLRLTLKNMEEFTRLWGSTASKISEKAIDKAQKYSEKKERKKEKI